MENYIPKTGDIVYIDTQLHLSHGEDDIIGGRARIKSVEEHDGSFSIILEEWPDTSYNWKHLSEKQEALKVEFGDSLARSKPDHRPEFNRWN